MKEKTFLTGSLILIALFTMGQSSSCTAPFDATGNYDGYWAFEIKEGETVVDTVECPLSMTLTQDVTLEQPDNLNVSGTVHIDFSCLEEMPDLPEWFEIPEPTDVEVVGLMDENGKIVLASGGCGPGTCIILALDGQGEAEGEGDIPAMVKYSGSWGLAIGVSFLGNFGVEGTFEVTREE